MSEMRCARRHGPTGMFIVGAATRNQQGDEAKRSERRSSSMFWGFQGFREALFMALPVSL